jgi:hypothetical protein
MNKEARIIVLFGTALFGILEIAFIRTVFPSHYTASLLFIPLYFLLSGIGLLLFLQQRVKPGKAVAMFMLFNIAHITLSFSLLLGYYYIFASAREPAWLIAFGVFYLFFMALKMVIIYRHKPSGDDR